MLGLTLFIPPLDPTLGNTRARAAVRTDLLPPRLDTLKTSPPSRCGHRSRRAGPSRGPRCALNPQSRVSPPVINASAVRARGFSAPTRRRGWRGGGSTSTATSTKTSTRTTSSTFADGACLAWEGAARPRAEAPARRRRGPRAQPPRQRASSSEALDGARRDDDDDEGSQVVMETVQCRSEQEIGRVIGRGGSTVEASRRRRARRSRSTPGPSASTSRGANATSARR